MHPNAILGYPQRLIVAGGRDFTDFVIMANCLNQLHLPDDVELVSGMAKGADRTAYNLWVRAQLPIHPMPADWNTYGRSAGYRRNDEMAVFADALVAFWDGTSRGTAHMLKAMRIRHKPLIAFNYSGELYRPDQLP